MPATADPARSREPASMRRALATLVLAGAGLACLPQAGAQTGSAALLGGPIRIVVGYAPGGATDRAARLVADGLKDRLGVPVIVENKTGAGGRLAAQAVKATPADQNVLMIGNPAVNVVAPIVFKNVGYDQYKDFVPVAQVTSYDFAVAVGPSVPVTDINGLVAWLKANPGQANVGVPATGSLPHFFALMLGDKAGVKTQVVGYRGSAPLATDLLGGTVPVAVDTMDTMIPMHEAGKLKILAIGGANRSASLPKVPTLKESGFDVVADGWNTLFAPASMPSTKVDAIAEAVRALLAEPATRKRFEDAQMVPVSLSRAQTAASLDAYRKVWEPVVRASGIEQ
ncbi:MAG: tripartite tricarboxylate transporter substrate-binding protein [Lautropia sp.]